MKKFKLEYIQANSVLHCDALEKAKVFGKFLKKELNSNYNVERRYSCYGENTCYCLTGKTNILNYSPLSFWQKQGYTILEFNNYDWGNYDSQTD